MKRIVIYSVLFIFACMPAMSIYLGKEDYSRIAQGKDPIFYWGGFSKGMFDGGPRNFYCFGYTAWHMHRIQKQQPDPKQSLLIRRGPLIDYWFDIGPFKDIDGTELVNIPK